jgi:serine/threonine protein kinase
MTLFVGIVHGDIKPQNVLVFPDDEGEIVAKVCDFGYSTLSARNSEEQQIHLPISTPWNAPEVDRNARFSLHQAKLADVYSFGVLCLWLLLTDATPQNTMHIGKLKEDGELEQFVRGRIGDMPSLGTDQKNGLTSFFACALARDASLRSLDLKRIMEPVVQFE